MYRTSYSVLPVIVAGVVFTLASTTIRAQQPGQTTDATAAHACACCGNSGSGAMNHETAAAPAAPVDHAAMNHDAAPATDQAMAAGAGCCADMKMEHAAAKPEAAGCCGAMAGADHASMNHDTAAPQTPAVDHAAMNHDAATAPTGAGCCGEMAMNHAATKDAPAPSFGATTGCAADGATAAKDEGCCAHMAGAMSGGCCGNMAGMHASTK